MDSTKRDPGRVRLMWMLGESKRFGGGEAAEREGKKGQYIGKKTSKEEDQIR